MPGNEVHDDFLLVSFKVTEPEEFLKFGMNNVGIYIHRRLKSFNQIYNFFSMEKSVTTFAELKGKTIYTTGKGATPEYALNYLLEKNGLKSSDFSIEFKSEATEIVAALKANPKAVGILPEPFVTVAMSQIEDLQVLFDFTSEWKKCSDGKNLVTGVTVVRTAFLKSHKDVVNQYMKKAKASIAYVNKNPLQMATSVEKYGIVKAKIAEKAIPSCNLKYLDGANMKTELFAYLETLYSQNPSAVGGKLPDDEFFYQK